MRIDYSRDGETVFQKKREREGEGVWWPTSAILLL